MLKFAMPYARLPPMVLVVHPHFHRRRTGTTRHVESITAALTAAGHEARVIGVALAPDLLRITLFALVKRLRRGAAVWHAHRNGEMIAGLILRTFFRRLRLVFTRHSATPPSWPTRWLLRRADARVALTSQAAPALPQPVHVVGHGLDLSAYAPPRDRAAAWNALGLGGRAGVGVIGRLRPQKGQGDFVKAIAPLLDEHPAWRALLVGRVKWRERAWARGLFANPGLTWWPERADVRRVYQALTIMVQPSHSEGFSLVLLEAMASGCCVVAARLPHYPALIDDGRTGFFYPPGDVPALRALLARLMAHPEEARAVGEAAAREAAARFGIAAEAEALAKIYRDLAS